MSQVKVNLLLMGKTGMGKSLTGNRILGRPAFKISSKTESVTKDVQDGFAELDNHIVKVIDGPGIKDTDMDIAEDQKTASAKMTQALVMCDGGVDAFLFVYKYQNRFTQEDRDALEGLKSIFGEKFFNNLIVVVTMGDLFTGDMEDEGRGGTTFLEWCKEQTGAFRKLFDDCRERFILFNNKEKNENAMNRQRKEIIELACKVQSINGRYTSEAFEAAQQLREKFIIEKQAPILEQKIQEKCGLLAANLHKYIKTPNKADKQKIQESVAAMKQEISEQDKDTGLLKHLFILVERIEDNLENVDQLHTLTKDLEDTRKSKKTWTALGLSVTGGTGIVGAVGAVSTLTTIFAFTMPPVAIALAVGTAAACAVGTGVKYATSSRKEGQLETQKNTIKDKLARAGLDEMEKK